MAMKEYFIFPNAPELPEPHCLIVYCHIQDTCWKGVLPYSSAEMQLCILQPLGWASIEKMLAEKDI